MSNLFNGTAPEIDPNKDYHSELVGEGKKYRDPQALALSKVHADALIDDLKAQLSKAQQELQTQKRLEELLTTATQQRQPEIIQTHENHSAAKEETMNDLTAERIEQLISDRLSKHEYTRKASENAERVRKAAIEKFGDNYEQALIKIGQSVGLSPEELQKTAQDRPQLLLTVLDAATPKREVFNTPPATKLNPNIAPQNEERNWSYYQKVKAKDLKYYESDAVQTQMDRDAIRLGPSFFN